MLSSDKINKSKWTELPLVPSRVILISMQMTHLFLEISDLETNFQYLICKNDMSFQTCRNAKTSLAHYSKCAQIENEIKDPQ
jgi:hypothetical protein